MKKRLGLLITLLTLTLALCGCGGGFDAAQLLQGNLDVLYLGQYDEEYLKSVNLTEEQATALYDEGMETEYEYFAYYFDIDTSLISDETKQAIIDLYKQIYAYSKYEVGDTSKNGETYLVQLTIYPIDIISKFDPDQFQTQWQNRINAGEFDAMSDAQFEEAWAKSIIDSLSARVEKIGYLDPETISVQIAKDTDGYYCITDNDFQRIDELIIAYDN